MQQQLNSGGSQSPLLSLMPFRYKLIVTEDVCHDGNDTHQLKACEDQNHSVFVAIPDKSKAIAAQG